MALKGCPECGHQVSTKAVDCPSCGARVGRRNRDSCMGCVLLLLVFFIAIMVVTSFEYQV